MSANAVKHHHFFKGRMWTLFLVEWYVILLSQKHDNWNVQFLTSVGEILTYYIHNPQFIIRVHELAVLFKDSINHWSFQVYVIAETLYNLCIKKLYDCQYVTWCFHIIFLSIGCKNKLIFAKANQNLLGLITKKTFPSAMQSLFFLIVTFALNLRHKILKFSSRNICDGIQHSF